MVMITSTNKHKLARGVRLAQKGGELRDCVHLFIGEYTGGFVLRCHESSLLEVGESGSPDNPLRPLCDRDCECFLGRAKVERRERWLRIKSGIAKLLRSPFAWFASLPEKVQLLFLGILFLIVLGRVAPDVLDRFEALLRAYRGAT